jgi:hypothetical protein
MNISTYQASSVYLREYEKVFIGTNQEEGYESPFLSFTADVVQQILLADKSTYFHYPTAASSISIDKSNLIENGAVPGNCPFRSDRVFKKMANYARFSVWGDATPSAKQTGVWLCSWLSGNAFDLDQTPIWKDRWYNPGYIDLNTAYFITEPPSSVIVDIDSELTFDPGVWYRYDHIGNQINNSIVNYLTAGSALRLNYDSWALNVGDLTPYANDGKIINYEDNCIAYSWAYSNKGIDSVLDLNGNDQYVITPYNESYELMGDFSYNVWVKVDNWANIQGSHIISKGFRGGWDLKYNNGFFTPLIILSDPNGKLMYLNNNGKIFLTDTMPGTGTPLSLIVNDELFTWVIDNNKYINNKHLYSIDYTNDIVYHVDFGPTEVLTDLAIDKNKNLWVLNSATNTVSSFSQFGTYLGRQLVGSGSTRIEIDLNNHLSAIQCKDLLFDNNNNFWYINNDLLYKNGISILSAYNLMAFNCDSDNNIWLLNGKNSFTKYNVDNQVVTLSGNLGKNDYNDYRGINFTYEYDNGEYKNFIWITHSTEQKVYKCDINGNIIQKIDTLIYNFTPKGLGDFTGYQWCRKYDYLPKSKQAVIQADIYLGDNTSRSKYSLSALSNTLLNRDWNNFTFTYNYSGMEMKLYINSTLTDHQTLTSSIPIYYEYKNPMTLGTNVAKRNALLDEITMDNKLSFKGQIDDLKLYDFTLNNSDIFHIYRQKFDFRDIYWNMQSGNQNYLEEIERFFKFKMPGLKSHYYNIKLVGLQIQDMSIRETIEGIIKNTVKKIAPAYCELLNIIWE